MDVTRYLYISAALFSEKCTLVSTEQEALWTTEPVWKFLAPPGIKPRILDSPTISVITILTELSRSLC
jgi:hypothetical protein